MHEIVESPHWGTAADSPHWYNQSFGSETEEIKLASRGAYKWFN